MCSQMSECVTQRMHKSWLMGDMAAPHSNASHVVGSPHDGAGQGLVYIQNGGQPEIRQLQATIRPDEDVIAFDVPVCNVILVKEGQCRGQLHEHLLELLFPEVQHWLMAGSVPYLTHQVAACTQLHHHARDAARVDPGLYEGEDVAVPHVAEDEQLLQARLTLLMALAGQAHLKGSTGR